MLEMENAIDTNVEEKGQSEESKTLGKETAQDLLKSEPADHGTKETADESSEEDSSSSEEDSSSDEDSDEDEEEEEGDPTKCSTCKEKDFKYTCPKCSLKSCSLACVKQHKTDKDCDGKRPRSEFVKLSKMSDSTLTRDYHFLEEVSRHVDISTRDPRTRGRTGNAKKDKKKLTNRFRNLLRGSTKHNIKLQLMPTGLSRHTKNTSVYVHRIDLIKWHVEWNFKGADVVVHERSVPEDMTWLDALRLQLEPGYRQVHRQERQKIEGEMLKKASNLRSAAALSPPSPKPASSPATPTSAPSTSAASAAPPRASPETSSATTSPAIREKDTESTATSTDDHDKADTVSMEMKPTTEGTSRKRSMGSTDKHEEQDKSTKKQKTEHTTPAPAPCSPPSKTAALPSPALSASSASSSSSSSLNGYGNWMLRHKLKSYCRSVLPTLRLFVQRHPSPTSSPTYHELDLHSSVKASLANHVVIEFPTVYVALPSEVSAYTLSTEEDKTAEEVNAEREEKAKAEGQE